MGGHTVGLDQSIPNCTLTSSSSTCATSIAFSAPATLGNYSVVLTPGGLGGETGLAVKKLTINFTVAAAATGALDTKLTVAKQCLLLNQGDADLTAKLEELDGGAPIPSSTIDFYIDPALVNDVPTAPSIGSAATEADGIATLTHNVNGLAVGDYTLYAEFGGDASYNPSNDSNILGVSYFFAGFRQPINAEGNSIFGGRVIPIKIKLLDGTGAPVTDAAPTVWLTTFSTISGVGEVLEQVSSVSAADTGNTMRYAPDDQQYIYNWDATGLANGTYAVVVDLGDSASCRTSNPYAIITVAKKGGKK